MLKGPMPRSKKRAKIPGYDLESIAFADLEIKKEIAVSQTTKKKRKLP